MITGGERHVSFKILMAVPTDWPAERMDTMLSLLVAVLAQGSDSVRYVDGRWSAPGLGLKPLPSTGVAKILAFMKEVVMADDETKSTALRVNDMISEVVGVELDTLHAETNIDDDLGADEVDRIEVIMAVEERFGLQVSDEEADRWKTVGDVVAFIEKASAAKDAPKS